LRNCGTRRRILMTHEWRPREGCGMPVVCRFSGIVIAIHYRDHDPPHFHAHYGGAEVLVEIETGRVTGSFPSRPLKLVEEWRKLRREELLEDWRLARAHLPLRMIAPPE
jgi:hypothetical protein